MNTTPIQAACHEAAALLADADAVLITAGAGIGIDSGLPDFRGEQGFWRAYPALGTLGMRFHEIASPAAFHSMPEVAWGFYGHRLQLYRRTQPHAGFARLLDLSRQLPKGIGVFTSNVDGQFQKAGITPGRIVECHGTIHHLQCLNGCGQSPWPADEFEPVIDAGQCKLMSALPTCPACGGLARPNILMFSDWDWDDSATERQLARLDAWLARTEKLVVMEIGAGTAIPTVRHYGESLGSPLIRINPTEAAVGDKRCISIELGALEGITQIMDALANLQ
ncbi:NAD-dependent SIR2 family protein deacetylase [Paucimonas lemoignei]|uniref:protein acetyllysine N-acetyltransferase n=1 Tax=Paucimonas lemoignei TaxID=29443 RepID=A0A4R3HUS3_PAULE|nr:Sir2 family NAD-dependent protein deacetylase [Paucimonas lemoignei]TCS35775.1 NAD-dependent SIR2 family protein deacetylase [Paucimonas lemoignei]